jgi:hypothetical protein
MEFGHMELKLPPEALVVFIDDTGDETFHDPVNPVFGLGGCAVLGRDLDTFVRQPWSLVRSCRRQKPTALLHASSAQGRMRPEKERELLNYFTQQRFGRVGVLASINTRYKIATLPDAVLRTTATTLLARITSLVRLTPCTSVIGVFEDSYRHRGRLEAALDGLSLTEELSNGEKRNIPLQWYKMPKTAGEPALEVADFMMHAAAGYYRHRNAVPNKFKPRADAIWAPSDRNLSHFCTLDAVVENDPIIAQAAL